MLPIWMIVVGYLIGASLTFRWQLLARTETTERTIDKKGYSCDGHQASEWRVEDRIFSTVAAAMWPPVILVWTWGKVLFPKGINTKYAIQKERILVLEAQEAEHKKCLEILRESRSLTPGDAR